MISLVILSRFAAKDLVLDPSRAYSAFRMKFALFFLSFPNALIGNPGIDPRLKHPGMKFPPMTYVLSVFSVFPECFNRESSH
jgi:hypothetical protein